MCICPRTSISDVLAQTTEEKVTTSTAGIRQGRSILCRVNEQGKKKGYLLLLLLLLLPAQNPASLRVSNDLCVAMCTDMCIHASTGKCMGRHAHTYMLTGVSVGVWTCMHEDAELQMYRHADM